MSSSVGRHAIVVGAGMAGLAATAVLSSFFERVSLLERDTLAAKVKARIGTPQSSQLHVLLGGGFDALARLFADFGARLNEAGAIRVRTGLGIRTERPGYDPFSQRDLGWDAFCLSRPLLEFEVRRLVEQIRNVEIRSSCRALELVASSDAQAVVGLHYEDVLSGNARREQSTDLIVDASSRGAISLTLLQQLGYPLPEETEIGIGLAYATATFPAIEGQAWQALIHRPSAPGKSRGAFIFPIENGLWQVALNTYHEDAPPQDIRQFRSFAKSLRTSTCYDAIRGRDPVSGIHRFVFPSSRRRHFERLRSFPHGLLVLGDAICRVNPVYGQGMSLALLEVEALARALEVRVHLPNPLHGLALTFFKSIQEVIGTAWGPCEGDFVYPKTTGNAPADLPMRQRYSSALVRVAAENFDVHRAMARVAHLLEPPSVLRSDSLADRVKALLVEDHEALGP